MRPKKVNSKVATARPPRKLNEKREAPVTNPELSINPALINRLAALVDEYNPRSKPAERRETPPTESEFLIKVSLLMWPWCKYSSPTMLAKSGTALCSNPLKKV